MIINTMKYINLTLEYIKSITEAPVKKDGREAAT